LAFGRTRWIDASGQPLLLCDQDFAVLSDRPAERFTQVARDMSINNQINAGLIRTAALRKTRLLGNYPSSDLVLMAEAHRLCVHFTEAPTVALALIKRLLDESWANDLDAQLDLERETQREASLTPDYAEGMRAFFEKRSPAFSGRRG